MAVLAPALVRLRSEVNQRWPRRDRGSDGWIGDTSHKLSGMPENGGSDHNPNRRGVVNAVDIDVDGIDPVKLVASLIRHPAVNYVIYNRRIWSRTYGFHARAYNGSNPHTKHVHVSLRQAVSAENTDTPWGVLGGGTVIVPATHPPASANEPSWAQRLAAALPVLRKSKTARRSVRKAQALLNLAAANLKVDGFMGDKTVTAVRVYQRHRNLTADGVIGPKTWSSLAGAMPTTRRGVSGMPVHRVQALLRVFGADVKVDGDYGPKTEAAVRVVQRRYEMTTDGVVGPLTWTVLLTR